MRFPLLRIPLFAACFVSFAFALPTSGQDVEARQIVDKAIAATGGNARLSNLKAATWKTQGTAHFSGKPTSSKTTLIGELPGRFRRDSESIVNGEKIVRSFIVNGNQGWSKDGDQIKPLTDNELLAEKDTFFHKQVALTLVPLKDKRLELNLVGEEKINGKPASVISVKHQGFHTITLYIDKETSLVVKSESLGLDSRTGKQTKLEHFYSQHKDFHGIKYPVKTTTLRDGKLMLEVETLEFTPESHFDANRFLP
jgi:hypothetical protein